ncbi:hypothetical protein V5F79_17565 [Xanthobacter flavus]|uniref:glycine-rich domain-containing protein n=1 Tax=Xanthobacter flavus TaxID=281 RepID=UPI00372A5955
MATNEFLPFATGSGAGVMTQTDWAALADRLNGFGVGVADELSFNKGLRQAASIASMIGQFTADYGGDALDNGDLVTLEANFKAALSAWIASGESPVDLSNYLLKTGDTMTGALGAPVGFRTAARLLNTATSLLAADLGKFIELTATSSIVTTIPTPVSVGGGRLRVWNNTVYAQTLSTPAGAFLGPNVSSSTTIGMLPQDVYDLESDGSNWILCGVNTLRTSTYPIVNFYSTSATWSRDPRSTRAFVLMHAAGGAGGGATAGGANSSGSGGGAGEFRLADIDTSSTSTALVTIGAGGSGAVSADGGSGGDSSFGSLVVAKGGYGGSRNAQTGANISNGGSGGTGGWSFPGSGGGSSQAGTGGEGGVGAFGGGGRAGNSSQGNKNGGNGSRGGGGGGGDGYTAGNASGGNGGDGWALVVQI